MAIRCRHTQLGRLALTIGVPATGWGIRLIPNGWLWNVSGLGAVELSLVNGQRFRIGTDEPEQLATAIQGALKKR